MIPNHLFISRY